MAHHVYFPGFDGQPGGSITLHGDEAHHALKVKRLAEGDEIILTNGSGRTARTRLASSSKDRDGWSATLSIESVQQVAPLCPRVAVYAAAAKGSRLEDMVDGLSQVGAAEYRPLVTARTIVDPRPGKMERLERVAVEAMKQSGRAWVLALGPRLELNEALARPGVVVADGSGERYRPMGRAEIAVLVGPEGGWTPQELDSARAAGATIASFGPHIMRIETAAVVAAAAVLWAESGRTPV